MTLAAAPIFDLAPTGEFQDAAGPAAERLRRRQIIAAHPEVRALIGPNPYSAILVVGLAAGHLALAGLLADRPLWLIGLVAFCVGAFFAACLNAMIHEARHDLIFRDRRANHAIALVANLGLVTFAAMPFFRYHGWHHLATGDYAMDVGIPTKWEARWVGNRAWRKVVWLAAFPLFQWLRTRKFRSDERVWHGWMVANVALQLAADLLMLYVWGPFSLLYLLLSYAFAVGFHPLGTRVIQEHFLIAEGEETNNYIGWASLFECNFGYHIEHHDFPRIPWNRLPRVAKLAPEFYASKPVFRSRLALMISFITDPRWHLYRHAVQRPRS
jgi:sphingolipid delta-4 desaturase